VGGEGEMNGRAGCYPIDGEHVTEENSESKIFLKPGGHEER
jgi:hypothetical protein